MSKLGNRILTDIRPVAPLPTHPTAGVPFLYLCFSILVSRVISNTLCSLLIHWCNKADSGVLANGAHVPDLHDGSEWCLAVAGRLF